MRMPSSARTCAAPAARSTRRNRHKEMRLRSVREKRTRKPGSEPHFLERLRQRKKQKTHFARAENASRRGASDVDPLGYHVQRTLLRLVEHLPQVDTDDAQIRDDQSAEEPDRNHDARPSFDGDGEYELAIA